MHPEILESCGNASRGVAEEEQVGICRQAVGICSRNMQAGICKGVQIPADTEKHVSIGEH